jgi:hypothetical protein
MKLNKETISQLTDQQMITVAAAAYAAPVTITMYCR